MLISEVSKLTGLTKKAIEYYVEQGLVFPVILENGYRDFSETNVECLKKVSILRKLGVSVDEAKSVLLDNKYDVLHKLTVQKELNIRNEELKKGILNKLSCGASYFDVSVELKEIEQGMAVIEKLLQCFPGYYGRFVCLHFARFLRNPITTNEQQLAYQEIISFLDEVPALDFPKDLEEYLLENTKHIGTHHITDMLDNISEAYKNPDEFIAENKDMLKEYLAFKQSEEYKNSPLYKIEILLKKFNSTSGYYDIFIPAMKKLSVSYSTYYAQMEIANERLITKYPEVVDLYEQ